MWIGLAELNGKFIKSTRVKRRYWRCTITKSELPHRKLILKFNYKLHSHGHCHIHSNHTMSKVQSCMWINNANSNFYRIFGFFFVYSSDVARISFISNSILCFLLLPFHIDLILCHLFRFKTFIYTIKFN